MDSNKIVASAFEIISYSGSAKAQFSSAIDQIIDNNIEQAEKFLTEGKAELAKVHNAHFDLISYEAQGNQLPFSLLLTHAEDQFMSTENALFLAETMLKQAKKSS